MGSYTTQFTAGVVNRNANIRNGAEKLNGNVVYPGERFSCNEHLVPWTEDNGWKPAGTYSEGSVVDSLGGGICQVSSTLYNACLLYTSICSYFLLARRCLPSGTFLYNKKLLHKSLLYKKSTTIIVSYNYHDRFHCIKKAGDGNRTHISSLEDVYKRQAITTSIPGFISDVDHVFSATPNTFI